MDEENTMEVAAEEVLPEQPVVVAEVEHVAEPVAEVESAEPAIGYAPPIATTSFGR